MKAYEAPLFESRIVDKKLDLVRPGERVIAEGELHGRRSEILNPGGDDLWAFSEREGLLRSDDDDMPGPLYLCAVGLLGRRLKIPSDHQVSALAAAIALSGTACSPLNPRGVQPASSAVGPLSFPSPPSQEIWAFARRNCG